MTAKQHSAYIISININEEKDGNMEKVNKTATSSTCSIQQQHHGCDSTAFTRNDNRYNSMTAKQHSAYIISINNNNEKDGDVEKVNKTATSSTCSIQQQRDSTAFTRNDNR